MIGTASTVTAALVELRDLVAGGREFDAAISELAEFYSIKPDVLRARASREGGIADNISKLQRRQKIEDATQKYPGEWTSKKSLQEWVGSECGGILAPDEILHAEKVYEAILSERQGRNLKIMLSVVSKFKEDDDAPNT